MHRANPNGWILAASITASLGASFPIAAASPGAQEHRHSNRLIDAQAPYLLLHAHNPLDGYPWGPDFDARFHREHHP